jgi:hypothetical protein
VGNSIRAFLIGIKARFTEMFVEGNGADIAIALIVLLVGVGAFGLGRLSVAWGEGGPISMHMAAMIAAPMPLPLGGQVVASKTGKYYYYPWCGGAKTISQSNIIWFSSDTKAEAAGYAPASNCRGLTVTK